MDHFDLALKLIAAGRLDEARTALDRAAAAVERVRVALTAEPLLIDGHRMTLTFSAGVAVNDGPGDTVDELIARADRALYDAKERGRNRVEPHSREWRDVQG